MLVTPPPSSQLSAALPRRAPPKPWPFHGASAPAMGTMGLSPLSSLHAEPLFLGGDGRIRGPLLEILKEWPVDFKDPPQLGHRHGRLVNPQVDDKVRRAETAIELV